MNPLACRVGLVTLDLDGTLLGSTVFQIAGRELGHGAYIRYVDELYFQGTIGLKAAFYAEYPLFLGEPVDRVHAALETGDWVADIQTTVSRLRELGHEIWVLTDQPDWAASYLERFGIEDGVCTQTTRWAGDKIGAAVDVAFDKTSALLARSAREGFEPEEIVHVGNGGNDVPVFGAVAGAIAFNPSTKMVSEAADATVKADSLAPVLEVLG